LIKNDSPADASPLTPMWDGRRRVITCHRADLDSTLAPNSLPAVRAAVAAGAPRIEIDLRFLADDTMVVFHDPDLGPTTTGAGRLDACTWAMLDGVRSLGPGQPPIPRFADVVAAITGSSTTLHVDLKHDRPMPATRVQALVAALAPIRDQAIVGTQAYWNLGPLAEAGLPIALDPGYLWQRRVATGDQRWPRSEGLYGFCDDAPIAYIPGLRAPEYLALRVAELSALVPGAREWMVDIDTIVACSDLGFSLADYLHGRDVNLVAWTVQDLSYDRTTTASLIGKLFDLGVDNVIAKHGLVVARYLLE